MKTNQRWQVVTGSDDSNASIRLERDLSVYVAREVWIADANEIVASHNASLEAK